jgi:hypothetical protein
MRNISESEVLDLTAYEKARPEFQRRAMEAKAVRRVAIGPLITVFFENRLTMHYQLQEMLRAERVVRDEAIREEMNVWNDLIPDQDELSLTLMIEETDMTRAKARLHELRGLEEHVSLVIGGNAPVGAKFEEGWSDDNRISAVQFIRFALSPGDRAAFETSEDVRVRIDHPAYRHEARLPPATIEALREDLNSE